uniref:Leucine-rich repeat-containing protein 73 n=1 Tax=Phallusia mammillata TaxID=59560 RepID=A0A6F9DJ86_9ASCI|nr:leucine-rich repeat-containing protein 73 [Phallusia mammillata]
MLNGVVQICGEKLTTDEIKEICSSVRSHQVTLLSLRKCKMSDRDFERLMRSIAKTTSVLQLNLNLGVLSTDERVLHLSDALNLNRSIQSLFLHGNPLGERGLALLSKSLSLHPSIVNLDVGDCKLTDSCAKLLSNLLPPDGAKSGLKELVLSSNPGISEVGWSTLFCSIAASSCLRSLSVDYNPAIGDIGARMLAVIVAGSHSLQHLDMEVCGVTNTAAKVFLDLFESYPTSLHELVLIGNSVSKKLLNEIETSLKHNHSSDDEN